MSAPPYLMEDPREADRLAAKVDPATWARRYVPAELPAAARILDVGCGPAVIAARIAADRPRATVIGVDRTDARLTAATDLIDGQRPPANLRLLRADARALPFRPGAFDWVFCRFLLEYLTDPLQAVSEMARVTRPGGTVLLQDLDGQLLWHYPIDPDLQRPLERIVRTLGATGFDPFMGRKLYHLAHRAGLVDLRVTIDPYHLIAGAADATTLQQWRLKLDIARNAVVSSGKTSADVDALTDRFLRYLQRPDTLTYSVAFTITAKRMSRFDEPSH
jgi:SAM-dependent methyltransferase